MIPSFVSDLSARTILLEHLELTRANIVDGEQHIAQQKRLISKLSHDGRATATAQSFLRGLEGAQAMHIAHRKRLEQELVTSNPE